MKFIRTGLGLLISLMLVVCPLSAAQMRPLTLAELTRSADLVVFGNVQTKTCQRDGDGRIFTKVELAVSEVWKGTATNTTLVVYHGGGTIGDERAEVSGQVEYTIGEEVVAFLVFNPRGEPVTLGLCQGKFDVRRDPESGEKLAHNIFHGKAKSPPNNPIRAFGVIAPPPPARLTLNQLKQTVREVKP